MKKLSELVPDNENYSETQGPMWWQRDKEELPGAVFANIDFLAKNNYALYYDLIVNEFVYNRNIAADITNETVAMLRSIGINKNSTASALDTLVSMVIKNDPTIKVMSSGADYHKTKKAEKLTKYIQGKLKKESVPYLTARALTDCCVNGTGMIHVTIENNRLFYDLVRPIEIRFLLTSSCDEDPESVHIVKLREKYLLAKKYPQFANEIYTSTFDLPNMLLSRPKLYAERYTVTVESYSRCAQRHTISISNCVLLDENWDLKDDRGDIIFPIARVNYKPSSRKWFPVGLVGQVRSLQMESDRLLMKLINTLHTVAVNKVLLPREADVNLSSIDNMIDCVDYSGPVPPTPMQLGNVPPDLYKSLLMLTEWIYDDAGVSQITAQGERPTGDISGEAVKTIWSLQNTRFQSLGKSYEDMYIKLFDLTIKMSRMLKPDSRDFVLYSEKGIVDKITYADIDLDEEEYVIQPFVTSTLPELPEGKLEWVERMNAMGLLPPQEYLNLLGMPDTDKYRELNTADESFVSKQIADILDGKRVYPDPAQDADYAIEYTRKSLLLYKNKGLREEEIKNLELFLNSLYNIKITSDAQKQIILQRAAQQQMMQQQQIGTNPSFRSQNGTAVGPQPNATQLASATGNFKATDSGR